MWPLVICALDGRDISYKLVESIVDIGHPRLSRIPEKAMALIESMVEGPITSISLISATTLRINAMGVMVEFNSASGESIKTPTTELTVQQLADPTPFPGRTQAGFVGGTIIAEGEFDTDSNLLIAKTIEVEPAETVLMGKLTTVSSAPPVSLAINGVSVEMLTDTRLPSNSDAPSSPQYVNQYGFPIELLDSYVNEEVPTSVEGYFVGNVFHAFLFEFGGDGKLVVDPAATPQINIERAEFRDDGAAGRYEARGFLTTSHSGNPQVVEVYRVNGTDEFLLGQAKVQAKTPGFARWDFSERSNHPGGVPLVPELIRVKNIISVVDPGSLNPTSQLSPEVRPD